MKLTDIKPYLCFGGLFRLRYLYIDIDTNTNYVADSLFYQRKIPVKFLDEWARKDDKYRIVFCSIKKKYQKQFEEALDQIENKMLLLGYNDYGEYYHKLIPHI